MATAVQDLSVPEGVSLAPGEQVLGSGRFSVSNVLFFIHWQLVITNRRIVGRVPNTILAVIPLGFNQVSYPLPNVAGVAVRRAYSAGVFLFGVLFVLFGISPQASSPVGAIVIGLLLIVAAFRNSIQVTNSGGDKIRHSVSFMDRAAAETFVQQVNTAIATHAHPTGQAASTAGPSSSASDALAELQRLRDQGHVTPDEFEAKRREIIARL
jgi:hypothetical protein